MSTSPIDKTNKPYMKPLTSAPRIGREGAHSRASNILHKSEHGAHKCERSTYTTVNLETFVW